MRGRVLERWGLCWRGFFTAEVVWIPLPCVLEPYVAASRAGGCGAGMPLRGVRGSVLGSDVTSRGSGHWW